MASKMKSVDTKNKRSVEESGDRKKAKNVEKKTGDDRFASFATDPRFKSSNFSNKATGKKVVVDQRFKAMFEDEEFKSGSKAKVDKYGRKLDKDKRDDFTDLSRHYVLNDEDEARLEQLNRIARGEVEDGDSSSDASSDEDDEHLAEEEAQADEQAELLPSELGMDSTKRLAIIGCDWDHIRAVDLFAVLKSFTPSTGAVVNVAVFSSEFGRERMAKEEVDGPFAANGKDAENDEEESDDDDESVEGNELGKNFDPEKLRKYEKERLLYYFAVVTCDSVETAEALYRECDGLEFEHSSVGLDLRFVPDELKFDPSTRRDMADEVPETYTPIEFVNKSLQQSKVTLSWDEPEHDRRKLQQWGNVAPAKTKNKNDKIVPLDELEAFIASEDSDDDSEEEEEKRKQDVERYRSLLSKSSSTKTEADEGEDVMAAISSSEEEQPKKTAASKKKKKNQQPDSDGEQEAKPETKKMQKAKTKRDQLLVDEDQLAGLQEDDDEQQKSSRKKTKSKKKKVKEAEAEEVDVDVQDERFAPLLTDPEFAFDRTDPRFKPSKATRKIEEERKKRLNARGRDD